LDTIKFIKDLDAKPEVFMYNKSEVSWQHLTWTRKDNYKYFTFIKNLYVQVHYGEFSITNSLHKFYHGNNYKIFTFKEMKKAINMIDNYFDFSIYDARVTK